MRILTGVLLLAVAQGVAPRAPEAPPPTTGTAIVRGKVVDKETGAPIARAVVALRGRNLNQQNFTDDRGAFEFAKLPAGTYQLQVIPGEHRATHLVTSYPVDQRAAPGVTLKDGEERTDIVIALPRSLAVSGRVVDLEGHPLAGVQMLLQTPGTFERSLTFARLRGTDDRGVFRIHGVAPGRYLVCAERRATMSFSEDHIRAKQFVKTCHPSATAPPEAREVVVSDTDVDGIEVRMQRHDTYEIKGIVVAADGTPVENAGLDVTQFTRFGSSGSGTSLRGQSTFTVSNVPPGTYAISASIGTGRYGDVDDREPQYGSVTVDVTTSDIHGLVLQLKKSVTIRGRVLYEDPPTEMPTSPLEIEAASPRVRGYGGSLAALTPVKAAEDGAFTVAKVFGPRIMRVRGQFPRGYILKAVQYRGRDITDIPTEFEGDPAHEVDIVLTNRTAELSGVVIDEKGGPAVGVTVFRFPADPARWKGYMASLSRTGKDGRYRFSQVAAGDYYVVAVPSSSYSALDFNYEIESTLDRASKVAQRITILERDRRTADLHLTTIPEKK